MLEKSHVSLLISAHVFNKRTPDTALADRNPLNIPIIRFEIVQTTRISIQTRVTLRHRAKSM